MSEVVFCNEPIIDVYMGYDYDDTDDMFLDCYEEDITLYLAGKCRYLFETENHFIFLEYSGVKLVQKTDDMSTMDIEKENEYFRDSHEPPADFDEAGWTSHEYLLFVGERLLKVENHEDYYNLTFDDIELKVVPCTTELVYKKSSKTHSSENLRMYGFDRYIKAKCSCGSDAEIILNFVKDYEVKCSGCQNTIYAHISLEDAITEWNESNKKGRMHFLFSQTPPNYVEIKKLLTKEKIISTDLCKIALQMVCDCGDEYKSIERLGIKLEVSKTHSAYLYDSLKFLLDNGLNPNEIIDTENPFYNLLWVDAPRIAPRCIKLFLDYGGNPNLNVGEPENIFEFFQYEWLNKDLSNMDLFYCWLLLLIYDAERKVKITMCDNHTVEELKNFEKYDCHIIGNFDIVIFDKKTKENIAYC